MTDQGSLETHQQKLSKRPQYVDLEVGPGFEPDNRRFGGLLERLRKHAGLSRADAAAKLGFSAEYLRLIEAGKRTPALGQMRSFLNGYGADGAVEEVMPGGDRPDLVVIDPLGREAIIVEFKSRIREARRSEAEDRSTTEDLRINLGAQERVYDSPSPGRAADIGVVVLLLVQAKDSTVRQIRELLEDAVGKGAQCGDD